MLDSIKTILNLHFCHVKTIRFWHHVCDIVIEVTHMVANLHHCNVKVTP